MDEWYPKKQEFALTCISILTSNYLEVIQQSSDNFGGNFANHVTR